MERIEIAISDDRYRAALRHSLAAAGAVGVVCVDQPSMSSGKVLVVDAAHLQLLPRPLLCPQCIVFVTDGTPAALEQAWEAGVHSVVSAKDSVHTAVLAVLAARLRMTKALGPSV